MQKLNPIANPKNIVKAGKVRFTVITSRIIRCEWQEKGLFEDRETLEVVNRRTPVVKFETIFKDGCLKITTDHITLKCCNFEDPFIKETLKFEFFLEGKKHSVGFGQKDSGNLKGTARTLDENRGNKVQVLVKDDGSLDRTIRPVDLGTGLISKNGWAIIDDSSGAALEYNKEAGKNWVCERHKGEKQDFYFFAYGHDYISAVKDASLIFGAQPLPPRYAFGYFYSRYWNYTDQEIEKITDTFDRYSIPFDVFVIDMDWHKWGWTGYTWDDTYFPDYKALLKFLKTKNIKVTLNLHPAEGVKKHEVQYNAMCKAVGKKADGKPVKFDCLSPKFMKAYFEILHHPYEKDGVDFWWIDWQQFQKTSISGLKVLPWLNRLHYEDMESRKKRPLILSRYGGIGSGRYPLGFSGDTHSFWDTLKFQPYFTASAANVLFGYWSHDICGHFSPTSNDPELHLRWIQLGIYSPIFRTHTTKSPRSDRRIWAYPEPFNELMVKTLERRYELVPYIYTEARKCFDSGLSIVRPLYYHFPLDENAYKAKEVFYFGSQMIIAPVYNPVDDTGLAKVRFFLPEGKWIDTALGKIINCGWHEENYLLSEIPVFVKPGTILPAQKKTLRLKDGAYESLVIEAFSGGNGYYELYEDDGISNDYRKNKAVVTSITHREKGFKREITLSKPAGTFKGYSPFKELVIKVILAQPAKEVKINGQKLKWSYYGEAGSFGYDGKNCTVVINAGKINLKMGVKVQISHDTVLKIKDLNGMKGAFSRADKIGQPENILPQLLPYYKNETLPVKIMQTSNRISRFPWTFASEIKQFKKDIKRMPVEIKSFETAMKKLPKKRWFSRMIDRKQLVLKIKKMENKYFGKEKEI